MPSVRQDGNKNRQIKKERNLPLLEEGLRPSEEETMNVKKNSLVTTNLGIKKEVRINGKKGS